MSYKRFAVDEKNDCTTVNLLNSFQGEFFFSIEENHHSTESQ